MAKVTNISPRTIDYYTQLGLIHPVKRTDNQYRYYDDETISRLKRIESMKKEKYSLEEIRIRLNQLDRVSSEEDVADKLTSLQLHMQQLEKEVKELEPLIRQLKPNQAKNLIKVLAPRGAACIEAILFLLDKGPIS